VLVLAALLAFGPAGLTTPAPPAIPATGAVPMLGPAPASPASPAATGVGAVLAVDDLLANTTTAGNSTPAEQNGPQWGMYDPVSGVLYIRGNSGQTLSTVDAATERATGTLVAGTSTFPNAQLEPTVAVDTANGDLLVTNYGPGNLTIRSGATGVPLATIALPRGPAGVVYDPDNGNFYVSDYSTATVSVVSGTSLKVTANISVGTDPAAVAYDPTDHHVFVANYGSANVSVIDTSTGAVIANPAVGAEPVSLAWDATDDLVGVASNTGHSVTVLSGATGSVSATRSVGTGYAIGLAYLAASDQFYAANQVSDNVTVIDAPSGVSAKSFVLPGPPQAIGADSANDQLYVACPESGAVTALNGSTDTFATNFSIPDQPSDIVVDGSTGTVFVVDQGTSVRDANLTVIDPATDRTTASIRLTADLLGVTFDPTLDSVEVADQWGNVTYRADGSTGAVLGLAPVGDLPGESVYDPTNGYLYVMNVASSTVTAIDGAGAPVATYPTGLIPSGIAVDGPRGLLFVCTDFGNVTVIDLAHPATRASIVVRADDLLKAVAYDPHSDRVYVADWTGSNITVIDPATNTTVGPSIPVGSDPSAILYDPANDTLFVGNFGSANVSVLSDATDALVHTYPATDPQSLAYDAQTNSVYSVGEPSSEVYAVNASTYASLGAPLRLGDLYAGGLAYDPDDHRLFVSDEFDGVLLEIGPGAPPTRYPVTFTESGLPAGTSWAVTLASVTSRSITASIVFDEPNGTGLAFNVTPVAGYVAAPKLGTVDVAGAAVPEPIDFSPYAGFSLEFSETGLAGGTSWSVSVNSVAHSGSGTSISLLVANGSYSFTIGTVSGYTANATSGTLHIAGASKTFDVAFTPTTSPPPSPNAPAPPISTEEWTILAVVIVAAALSAVAGLMRRRRKGREPPPTPTAPNGSPPSPPLS